MVTMVLLSPVVAPNLSLANTLSVVPSVFFTVCAAVENSTTLLSLSALATIGLASTVIVAVACSQVLAEAGCALSHTV